ncbi:hypothetical protein MLD38_039681 [Melastoma candidum]|uniref:Uncharacterized protein n=1 Tax=Melastoma candidum TaxID=119954 RepID=A0ACB9L3R0_9MYRT|nr:hypothetical protein MLD38_039681 [Melastoma candidum]
MACSSLRSNSLLFTASTIRCGGLRKERRSTLWRNSDVLSREAIDAVHSLKLSKSKSTDPIVATEKLGRLLKADVLNVFAELKRQNQVRLALLVYDFVRKEDGYEPDSTLHCDVIQLLGDNKMMEAAEEVFFSEFKREGIQPNTRAYTEMIGIYFRLGMTEKAMKMYEEMKASGCKPSKFTLTVMIRNLEKAGEKDLALRIRRESVDYVDDPRKFLQEVRKEYPRRRSLDLV